VQRRRAGRRRAGPVLHQGQRPAHDPAVAWHILEVLTPLALQATIDAADQIEARHDAALGQWRRQAEWEAALQAARDAGAELDRRESARPVRLSTRERAQILAIATDLPALWAAPSTTDRDCAAIRNLVTGVFRRAGFANIAHARRYYGRDDARILALYGYT